MFVHGISLSARTRLHFGENVTLLLVSDIRREASRSSRAGHGVTGMGLPGLHETTVTWIPQARTQKSGHCPALRLRRLATGLGAGAAISACGPAKCHAPISGKAGHDLISIVLGCYILIDFLLLGCFCQPIYLLDVAICSIH